MRTSKEYRRLAWMQISGLAAWGNFAVIALISSLLSCVASLILGGPMAVGLEVTYINTMRGVKPEIEQLFRPLSTCFLTSFIMFLLQTVFLVLWFFLFFIPGIIKTFAYSMSAFLLALHPDLEANDAITLSRKMMDGHKGKLFLLNLSFIGWALLCVLTFGILAFWISPYIGVARANFFQDVKDQYDMKNGYKATA